MLTGKCREDFEKWLYNTEEIPVFEYQLSIDVQCGGYYDARDCFKELPLSMQFGVYVDFFESKGIVVDIDPMLNHDEEKYTEIVCFLTNIIELGKTPKFETDSYDTIEEAREQAILKANSIYNESK